MSQNRQPAGIPTGGQFAAGVQGRATVTLDETGPQAATVEPDVMSLFFTDAPADHLSPTDGSLDAYGQAAHAKQLLGQALTVGSGPARGSSEDTQVSYFQGMEYAATAGAASFLNPHDQTKRNHIDMAIQLAVHRGADGSEPYQAAVLADTHDLIEFTGADREVADHQLGLMLRAAVITHNGSGPDVSSDGKSAHQWNQLGMRNGFAEVAARWARPNAGDWTEAGTSVTAAITDGITDVDQLKRVARGQLVKENDGGWYDPYAQWEDADLAQGG